MKRVMAKEAYFIKLGREGEWEYECFRDGTLRIGYADTPHEPCLKGDWESVWQIRRHIDAKAPTFHTNQIRTFYEADENALFITFAKGLLHWCRPSGPVEERDDDHTRQRHTVDGWHTTSVGGKSLTTDSLSGHLLKVQGFRGTICKVSAIDYLLRKLNDELSPEVAAAEEAEKALMDATVVLIQRLTWQDFELLVDPIFSRSGWQRISRLGGVEKTIDFELVCLLLASAPSFR